MPDPIGQHKGRITGKNLISSQGYYSIFTIVHFGGDPRGFRY